MKFYYHNAPLKYDGSQLSPLFAYKNFDVRGDSVVAFRGACYVKENMCDIEDIVLGEFISSKQMLHFIIEVFKSPPSLSEARMFQLLVVQEATRFLKDKFKTSDKRAEITSDGDDIFIWDGKKKCKMSVSIATVSSVSHLIHLGINLTTEMIPKGVNAGSIDDFNKWTGCKVTASEFAHEVGRRICYLYDEDVLPALNKVMSV